MILTGPLGSLELIELSLHHNELPLIVKLSVKIVNSPSSFNFKFK